MASFPSQISVRKEKPVIYYFEVYVWKLNLVILSFSYKSTQHVFQHRQFFGILTGLEISPSWLFFS